MNILVNVLIQQTFMEFNILYILHIIHYMWHTSYIMYIYIDNMSTFFSHVKYQDMVNPSDESFNISHDWSECTPTDPHIVSDCITYIHLSDGPEWLQSSESTTHTLPGPSGQPPGSCRRLFSYVFQNDFFQPVFKIVNYEPLQKNTLKINQT